MKIHRLVMLPLVAGSLLITACSDAETPTQNERPPLEGASLGGDFVLTGEDGEAFDTADLSGRSRLVYFGYSYCPDICPVDTQKLMRGLAQFEKADPARATSIAPLFVTVDPARDDAAALATFTDNFHPRLVGLTGSEEEVGAVMDQFAVSARKIDGATPGSYLMAHSQLAFLLGPDGEPLALLPLDDPSSDADEGEPAKVASELARWTPQPRKGG